MTTAPSQGTARGSHYIGDYLLCQHYFWLRHVQQVRRRATYAAPQFGSAWHKVLEYYFWCHAVHERPDCIAFCPEDLLPRVEAPRENVFDGALELGLEMLAPIRESEEGTDEYERAKIIFERAWQAYFREVIEKEEPVTRQVWLPSGAPAIECAFELPLPSGLTYTGRLDRVIEQRGLIGVRDYKTTAAANFVELDAHLGLQFTGYWAGFAHLFGRPPDWVLVDVMEKPRRNARLASWVPTFRPVAVSRTPAHIDEWTGEIDAILQEITAKASNPATLWYKARNDRCYNQFYRECPYLNICTTPGKELTQEALGQQWIIGDSDESISDVFSDL
jgi:hypothetical protein